MSSFAEVLAARFPGALREADFVARTHAALEPLGFHAGNTIALVGVCRDELCRTLGLRVHQAWGEDFLSGSLGGMHLLGRAGFRAAHRHAPQEGGRERYVHFAMPHLGIGADGELGVCERIGRPGTSHACGALWSFLAELREGRVHADLDPDDVEMSLLRARLLRELPWGATPDLAGLTLLAYRTILEDLERMLSLVLDPRRADYAVLAGVLIHGPGNEPFVWPGTLYAVVEGERRPLEA